MAVTNITLTALGSSEFQDTANTNSAITVKGSAGTVYLVFVDNSALASVVYVKLYDSAGAIVVGTTAPDWIFKISASTKQPIVFAPGQAFASGLQVATVTTGGTAGTTAPATPPSINIVYS